MVYVNSSLQYAILRKNLSTIKAHLGTCELFFTRWRLELQGYQRQNGNTLKSLSLRLQGHEGSQTLQFLQSSDLLSTNNILHITMAKNSILTMTSILYLLSLSVYF